MIDWTHWHNEPYLIGGLIFLGWLHALATGPFRGRLAPSGTAYPLRESLCFYLALVIFYLAVGSPLDQAGERFLLSAHMIQHQLIIYPAAILFLLGIPVWLARHATARTSLRLPFKLFTHPGTCALAYTAVIGIWHLPALYDWALRVKSVHILEHVTFFIVALLYWWPFFSPSREFPPIKPALQMLYLVAVTLLMTPLFAYLAFSSEILYPTYEFAPRLFADFTPAQDQLLGAAIMKLGGMFVSFLALIFAFYRWYQSSERSTAVANA
ncbi:cytochrome c oxidase assembly protein [bacterium]|jgi:putative membrane protein|nr:cytochrome c oxidase assembly protein [bacterium]